MHVVIMIKPVKIFYITITTNYLVTTTLIIFELENWGENATYCEKACEQIQKQANHIIPDIPFYKSNVGSV